VWQTVLEHAEFEVNDAIIGVLANMRGLFNFKPGLMRDNLDDFLHRKKAYIREYLAPNPEAGRRVHEEPAGDFIPAVDAGDSAQGYCMWRIQCPKMMLDNILYTGI
jgi:hypothetical protein